MMLRLTELSGKSLILVVGEFALDEPLPSQTVSTAGSRIRASFGTFFVKETPAEIVKMAR